MAHDKCNSLNFYKFNFRVLDRLPPNKRYLTYSGNIYYICIMKQKTIHIQSKAMLSLFSCCRLVPKATKDLAEHIKKVLVGHPTFTITSISILGREYINLLQALPISPPLPEHARALMLISRLNFESEPIVILLPLESMSQGTLVLCMNIYCWKLRLYRGLFPIA